MTEQATVLYDFAGISENGEISLREGEIITVHNRNIGDGWWDGETSDGRYGLFPEAYVQLKTNENHVVGSSIVSPRYTQVPGENYEAQLNNNNYNNGSHDVNDADEDGWSEDWDDSSSMATTIEPQMPGASKQYGSLARDLNSVERSSSRISGSVSKNFNRFSLFVKHGGENYMLGKADARVRQIDQVQIVIGEDGLCWKDNEHKYTCTVEDPRQHSKMKGLKKFVCYHLTPSDTAVTVQRRYKHFDWLYDRLVERYPMIAIPRLPEKQAAGRFEDEFIEARMARLKLWMLYICGHPVLSRSSFFRNFLTITEQKAWKMSKRQAEKDELASGNFFLTISLPPTITPVTDPDGPLEQFKKVARAMEDSISQYSTSSQNLAQKHSGLFKREYQSFAKSINNVAASFNLHQSNQNKNLSSALKQAGQTYHRIGELYAKQPKEDLNPMTDHLWLYKGLLDTMPDVWHMQSGAMRKVRECQKLREEGKMSNSDCGAVAERADRVVCCMQAEISHFHRERIRDFVLAQRKMLKQQAEFFERIASELRNSYALFNDIDVDV